MMKRLTMLVCMLVIIMTVVGCQRSETVENELYKKEQSQENNYEEKEATVNSKEGEEKEAVIEAVELYPEFVIDETETTVTYIDQFGKETQITKNPDKVVIVFNSILGLWYYNGGTSMTKAKGTTNVPEEALDNMDMGSAASVSLEAVYALEPDLVILSGNVSSQVALAPILRESGIEVMIIDTKTHAYERFKANSYLFSKIVTTSDDYDLRVGTIAETVETIIEKAKAKAIEDKPTVASLFATSKKLSIDSESALTGEMIALLGGENILKSEDILVEGDTRVAFSIEALIVKNPDIIMVSTMGSVDACKENIDKMIEENPAWSELTAVVNNQVYYLPKEFSVYKPNQRYDEAFMYIAEILYPNIFGVE